VPSKKKTSWYGVRTLFRLLAVGKPKWTDRYFDPLSTLVEDRVVLFRAKDLDDAIRQAEEEAARYCKATRYENIYGQQVRLRFLRATDAFEMSVEGQPRSGSEVYSTSALVAKSVRDSRVIVSCWGKKERHDWRARNKFVDAEILKEMLAVMKQSQR